MSSSLIANLDRSLNIVPSGRCPNYFLYADGSVILRSNSWTGRAIQTIYDPTVANIVEVFMGCVDRWTALKNEQKFRVVTLEEFSQQFKRICLIGEFIFASLDKIEVDPDAKEKICGILSQLLGSPVIALPPSLRAINEHTFLEQLDLAMIWKFEERSPSALTPTLLKMTVPPIEVLDPSEPVPNILEIPAFYNTVIQRMENPSGSWVSWFNNWWNGDSKAQKSLEVMCEKILEDQDPIYQHIYASAKLYLGHLLKIFRTGKFPDLQVRMCLDELVNASHFCPGQWATDAERQYLSLIGREVTAKDKALYWKARFVDEHLKRFFSTVYTESEDAQNVHLMNTLLFHYGERLGKQEFKIPSEDIHVVKKPTSLPYQWPDVFRYLEDAWNKYSVESLKTDSQMNHWQSDIGKFLEGKVKEKIPTVKDPGAFVLAEYFDEGVLNDRGAIRFLKETLGTGS
jgi:hypothetical protein